MTYEEVVETYMNSEDMEEILAALGAIMEAKGEGDFTKLETCLAAGTLMLLKESGRIIYGEDYGD